MGVYLTKDLGELALVPRQGSKLSSEPAHTKTQNLTKRTAAARNATFHSKLATKPFD